MKRALLIAAAIALTVPAGAGAATKSKVTIDRFMPKPPPSFIGQVKSPKKSCMKDRKVTLYFKPLAGDWSKAGASLTEKSMDRFFWSVSEGKFPEGKYQARIKPGNGCEGDRSKILGLVDV